MRSIVGELRLSIGNHISDRRIFVMWNAACSLSFPFCKEGLGDLIKSLMMFMIADVFLRNRSFQLTTRTRTNRLADICLFQMSTNLFVVT